MRVCVIFVYFFVCEILNIKRKYEVIKLYQIFYSRI